MILIIRKHVNVSKKQTNSIIILGLFPYIGLITHREAQLRSELSEAVDKAAETGQSISEGMYIGFFLNLFIVGAIYYLF